MNIINENNEKIKRYLLHELQTRINAVKTYRNGNSISFVCRKYHISRVSLYRWNKQYDGTIKSLIDKSHKPLSKHPKAHTDEELKWIENLIKRHKNDNITLGEYYYPPISTIEQDFEILAKTCIDYLISKIENPDSVEKRVFKFPCKVRERKST